MEETNQEFQAFRKALQQALTHLFDPDYVVPGSLAFLVRDHAGHRPTLRSILVQEIQALKTDSDDLTMSRTQRSYNILQLRYIDGLSQEMTAEQLQMSLRSLQRAQRQAILFLAYRLWSRIDADQSTGDTSTQENWRSQLDEEIGLLEQSRAGTKSDIVAILNAVNHITKARSQKRYDLQTSVQHEPLMTTIHASILQQILLSLLEVVAERAPDKVLQISAQQLGDSHVRIELMGGKLTSTAPLALNLVEGLLDTQQGCQLEVLQEHPFTLALDIPLVMDNQSFVIMFVDDNADLATLFSSYCTGTSFELVHVNQGSIVQQRINEIQPDLIILDVMLPDVDGWELLISLQANPITSKIPVIVCSVVTDPNLALDLGARLYLQKPVWREKFLDAVEKIMMNDN